MAHPILNNPNASFLRIDRLGRLVFPGSFDREGEVASVGRDRAQRDIATELCELESGTSWPRSKQYRSINASAASGSSRRGAGASRWRVSCVVIAIIFRAAPAVVSRSPRHPVRRAMRRRRSASRVMERLVHEPRPALALVDPVLEKARRCDVVTLVADGVDAAHRRNHLHVSRQAPNERGLAPSRAACPCAQMAPIAFPFITIHKYNLSDRV